MAFEDLRIYLDSVATSNRRDKPYYENTVGTVIDGGATGILDWAADNNRKAWARIDASSFAYYELEVLSPTSIRVYSVTEVGDETTTDVTVAASSTYTNLVDGVSVPLHSSLTPGDKARVYPAIFVLENATMFPERGETGDTVELAINNPGTVTHNRTELAIGRGGYYENTAGQVLAAIHFDVINPTADVYAVTVEAGTGSDFKVIFTGTHNTYSADNVVAGTTGVALDDVAATGLRFDLDIAVQIGDTATLVVSDFADALELAPDNAGSPGTWVVWNDVDGLLLDLTATGSALGQVPASGTVIAYLRGNPDISHNIGRGLARLYTISFRAE